MRWAVLLFAAAFSAASAWAENISFDVMPGAWAVQRYRPGLDVSARGGLYVAADFRLPRGAVAYEATFNYRDYNGVQADASALGLENRLPIYFTGVPLRVYAAPAVGFWRFYYGPHGSAAYGEGDADFAFSLGGNLGVRVAAGGKGSYVDISYGYQGTKVTGPNGFFGSRRIFRAKGNIGVTSHVGFGVEAGAVEEGWYFTSVGGYGYPRYSEAITTFHAGSPYVLIGPHFSF